MSEPDGEVEALARTIWEGHELAVRGDGKHGDWESWGSKARWREIAEHVKAAGYTVFRAPESANQADPSGSALPGTDDSEEILSTLDTYIKALGEAVKRFQTAAASGDTDAETDAADDLAGLVDRFVRVCTDWPKAGSVAQ
ncbi:hypothetical protein [Mycobacteroides abscessus]|uniref:Uncharacterized protein n=1 Tax=Mycobacteroides abscessus subsp. massiliense TaxID=1962118 RepID=A0A4D8RPR9_9MYCO|nr:hypothetical protein [Mycobacteroides abscessus]QCO28923.1 hypothetical protein CFE69_23540 [Mycobacteroides abscessus subsp. massiliense]SHY28223.1 Uncharacterised protein [Mycobacteroides abscessus subsp. abscessus]SID71862.1 Uncharacterised protein [Mycobacteroides abscessus subsp. abscessus]SIK18736.1 Uncharacterised protein [Mycobacteroides abscessus subsp. abscessus]SIM43145.1 Uncharacterised protein [Mycobacteroides abscessus subsp. abscessus]